MRMILMGPPGAGKGTQAKAVADGLGVPAVSTGDIFCKHVSDSTRLGVQAAEYLNAGEYVPDEITIQMVRDRLSSRDARGGFVLDGYPRTVEQLTELDELLGADRHGIDSVVLLNVKPDDAVSRLLQRSQLDNRTDDTESVICHRLTVYSQATAPVLELYEARQQLVTVDGSDHPNEVARRLASALPTMRSSQTHKPGPDPVTAASELSILPRPGSENANSRSRHAHDVRSEEAL